MTITKDSTFKIIYFPADGRGFPARLACYIGGLKLENAFPEGDFKTNKDSLYPYGQLPVLVVDDSFTIAQSGAIIRLVGKVAGLYPDDIAEAAKVDEIMAAVDDTFNPLIATMSESDEEKKKEARLALLATHFPRWLGALSRRISGFGGKFSTGDKLTIADISVLQLCEGLGKGHIDHIPIDIMDSYPVIKALAANIKAHEKVAAYYAERAAAGRNY